MIDAIFNVKDPNIEKVGRLYGRNAALCWKVSNISERLFIMLVALMAMGFIALLLLPGLRLGLAASVLVGMAYLILVPMTAYSVSLFALSLIMKDYLWSFLILAGFSVFFKMFRKI